MPVFHLCMNQRFSRPIALLSLVVCCLVGTAFPSAFAASRKTESLVYFGTYTGKKSKGIYVSRFDAASGKLGAAELAAEVPSPSFLAAHPKGGFLYAVNEVSKLGDKPAGGVSAFALDKATGKLTTLNQQSSGGSGPCHIITDATGANVLVA